MALGHLSSPRPMPAHSGGEGAPRVSSSSGAGRPRSVSLSVSFLQFFIYTSLTPSACCSIQFNSYKVLGFEFSDLNLIKLSSRSKQERLDFLNDSGLAVGKGSNSDGGGFKALEAKSTDTAKALEAPPSSSSSAAVSGALFEVDKPHSANDAWRKLHSDPLLMIRQREQQALARIKNNSVQMAIIRKSVCSSFVFNLKNTLTCKKGQVSNSHVLYFSHHIVLVPFSLASVKNSFCFSLKLYHLKKVSFTNYAKPSKNTSRLFSPYKTLTSSLTSLSASLLFILLMTEYGKLSLGGDSPYSCSNKYGFRSSVCGFF